MYIRCGEMGDKFREREREREEKQNGSNYERLIKPEKVRVGKLKGKKKDTHCSAAFTALYWVLGNNDSLFCS